MLKTLKQCQVSGSDKKDGVTGKYPMVEFYYDYTPLDKGCPLLKNASSSSSEAAADGAGGAGVPAALGGTQVPTRPANSKPNAAKEKLYTN